MDELRVIFVRFTCDIYFICSRSERPEKTRETNLHEISNARVREGVPHESLPHAEETHRNGACALSNGKTNQNMVPKPKDEVKERNTSDKRVERAREAGAGAEGGGGGGGRCGRAGPPRALTAARTASRALARGVITDTDILSQSAERSLVLCL